MRCRNPEFWSAHSGKTLQSIHALTRDSMLHTVYLDYKAALDNDMLLGFWKERLLQFFDSMWFFMQNVDDTNRAIRKGRRWCRVRENLLDQRPFVKLQPL